MTRRSEACSDVACACRVPLVCLVCGGRGWLDPKAAGSWPIACVCGGRPFSTYRLARRLAEDPKILGRVMHGRATARTSRRVLSALAARGLLP